MATIEARRLTKRFGDVLAVDRLDLSVGPGVVTGFLGPNGAGKTTTLRMVLGLVTPTEGTVTIDGAAYRHIHDPAQKVGAVLEASGFHPARTARNHLRVVATVTGIPYPRVDECLELVGLADSARRPVGGFSMGMRQRLELARALLGDPAVLILDEPANGLDPQGIAWLRGFLKWYASQGRVVLISSHLLAEAQLIVDDVLIMADGRVVAHGSLEQLLQDSKRTVRVRTPDAAGLVEALGTAGMPPTTEGSYVVVEGATPEQVGPVMADNRIVVYEMTSSTESLEELFFALTGGNEVRPGHAAGAMGDYTHLSGAGAPAGASEHRP